MYPIPRAKIGTGPSMAAQYGDEDVSDRGLDDISLRDDDLHSVNLGSEATPGSRPTWMSMLDKPDFKKLHIDQYGKKGNASINASSYGTKANGTMTSSFGPIYDARHLFQAHTSLASYSVDGDRKQPWDTDSVKHRGRNTLLIVLGAMALLFLVAAITAGALYAVVEEAESAPSANRSRGTGGDFSTSSTTPTTVSTPPTTQSTTEPPTTTTTTTTTEVLTTSTPELTTTQLPTTTTTPETTTTPSPPPPTTTTTTTVTSPTTTTSTTTEEVTSPTTTTTTTESTTPSATTTTTSTTPKTTTEEVVTSPTTTTPVPTTTPQPQYIFITVARGMLHTPTNITCLWTHDQPYDVIMLEAMDTELGVQTVMVAFRDDGQHGSFYPELFSSSVRERPEGHLLITTIKNTTCSDGNANLLYRCSQRDNTRQRDASPLFLEIPANVAMTSTPPRHVIENTEVTLTCKATVESGGDVFLSRRPQTGNTFERMTNPLSVSSSTEDGGCYKIRTHAFSVTMEIALNGSYIRCQSDKPEGSSEEFQILVIPESVCSSSSKQLVPHPFEASMYIECSDQQPRLTVRSCSLGFVFDAVKATCVDPYVAIVTFAPASFVEGSALELYCLLSEGNYSSISLLKSEDAPSSADDILLATFTPDGRNQVAVTSREATASRSSLPGPVASTEFKVTLKDAGCSDAGGYFCRHDSGQTSPGIAEISIPPGPVGVTLGEDIVEGQSTIASCTGTVDNVGDVILTSYDDTLDTFTEATEFRKTTSEINSSDQCKSSLTVQFSSSLGLSSNSSRVRCETTSPVSVSRALEISIVPVSICEGKDSGTAVTHPYTLVKYVVCGDPIKVQACGTGLVWRQELDTCVDPGAAEVSMLSATANEGESLEITCSLSPGSYSTIGVFRLVGDVEQPMVYFLRNGTDSILSQRVTSTVRRLVGSATHMVSLLDQVTCTVAGTYVCKHDNGQMDSAQVTVYALPSGSSSVEVPEVLVGGVSAAVRCSSMVVDKANGGGVVLERASSADGPFTNLGLSPTETFIKSEDQCETTADIDYTVPDVDFAAWNGSYVRCRSDYPDMTTHPMMVLVIDPSICAQAADGSKLSNPYQPDGFLVCSGNVPQLQYCEDGKMWRPDLLNCAFTTDATVSARDTPVDAHVTSSVNITCHVTSGTYETVRLYQAGGGGGGQADLLLATFFYDGTARAESQRISDLYREGLVDGSELMTSQLTDVTCSDEGLFWCEHDNTQRAQVEVIVNVPPSVTMTPDDDFTPITSNMITCEANLDLRTPGVKIELMRRDPATGSFVDAGVPVVNSDALDEIPGCFQRQRTIFSQVFDLDWSETDVRCEVASPVSTSDVFNMLVIPGDICVNETMASFIAHPYSRFRFIMCFQDLYVVMPCPAEGYVYIPELRECVIDGTPAAGIGAPEYFNDLEDLTLTCYVTSGPFTTVELVKLDGDDTRTPVVTFASDFSATVHLSRDVETDSSMVDYLGVRHFRVTLKMASCQDVGTYACNLNNGQDKIATVDIHVPEMAPTSVYPEDIIADIAVNITCASREKPSAPVAMTLQRLDPVTNQWQEAGGVTPLYTRLQDPAAEGTSQCSVKAHFEALYDLSWNSSDVRCHIKDTALVSDAQTLYIIPGDYCVQYPMASPQEHPYSRNKYLYCFKDNISIFPCPDSTLVWSQSERQCVSPADAVAKSTTQRVSMQTTGNVAPISSASPETTTTTTTTTPEPTVRPDPEITVTGGNFTIGFPADVTCDVSYPMEGSVIMIFISDVGLELVATFDMDTRDGSKDTTAKPGMSPSRSEAGQVTTLTTTIGSFQCAHVGVYACSDDGGHTGSAPVGAVVPEQRLVFQPPTTMAASQEASFECSGVVDTSGRLYFSIKGPGQPDSEYRELDLPGLLPMELELDACTKVISLTLTSTFDLSYQGSSIRCDASSQEQGSEGYEINFS